MRPSIPLVIQDKTFVPGPSQLAAEDPTWDTAKWGSTGNLWFPHVYMPNQNPVRHHGREPDGSLGLRPMVLAACHRHSERYGCQPAVNGATPDEGPTIPGIPNPFDHP